MQPWQLNIRHLHLFIRTAQKGVLKAAAEAEHLSQPAATQAISKLEEQLEALLFHRQTDGMRLTDHGETLLPRVDAALAHIGSKRITNTQVRAFLGVARSGSYSQASRDLALATASLHRAVSDMAAALGTPVFEKSGRGIELTPGGRHWARRLGLAQAELEAGLDDLALALGRGSGRIVIGAMPLSRAKLIPQAIAASHAAQNLPQICVVDGSHAELIEPLRDGRIDFMIGAIRDQQIGPDIMQEPLFVDQPVIVARTGHPVFHDPVSKRSSIEYLHRYQWCIPRRGTPLRENWEATFLHAGVSVPRVHVECGSVLVMRQVLLDTDCLAVLSLDQVSAELDAGWVKTVCPAPHSLHRTIALTHRKDWRPTKVQAAFLAHLRVLTESA
ncbi:MAG: LysR family transcriptional regulator [Pseudomonadota bacterium]